MQNRETKDELKVLLRERERENEEFDNWKERIKEVVDLEMPSWY